MPKTRNPKINKRKQHTKLKDFSPNSGLTLATKTRRFTPGWEWSSCPGEPGRRRKPRRSAPSQAGASRPPPDPSETFPSRRSRPAESASPVPSPEPPTATTTTERPTGARNRRSCPSLWIISSSFFTFFLRFSFRLFFVFLVLNLPIWF